MSARKFVLLIALRLMIVITNAVQSGLTIAYIVCFAIFCYDIHNVKFKTNYSNNIFINLISALSYFNFAVTGKKQNTIL